MIVWWNNINGTTPQVRSGDLDQVRLKSRNSLLHQKWNKKTKQVEQKDDTSYDVVRGGQRETIIRYQSWRGDEAHHWDDIRNIELTEDLFLLAHGSSESVGGLSPQQLGTALNRVLPPGYKGKIKLISCESGRGPSRGEPFAQSLSRILGNDLVVLGVKGFAYYEHGRLHMKTNENDIKSKTGSKAKVQYKNGRRVKSFSLF